MGDPRNIRKKYKGPGHPWKKARIESENELQKNYGLKNKKEIWKAQSEIRRVTAQAKKLIRERGEEQAKKEEMQLLSRLYKLGLIEENAKLEDVLSLEVKNILDRRLQSIVNKNGMSNSLRQARQLVVHGHVVVNDRKINAPSYLVAREEESRVSYDKLSSFASEEHPERQVGITRKEKKERKELEETKETQAVEITEEILEKIEKEIGVEVAEN